MLDGKRKISGYSPRATAEGLTLYGVNFAEWSVVGDSRKVRILGLPYILVKMKKRLPPYYMKNWWVALYLGNKSSFVEEVAANCPADHPFRVALLEQVEFERPTLAEIGAVLLPAVVMIGVVAGAQALVYYWILKDLKSP